LVISGFSLLNYAAAVMKGLDGVAETLDWLGGETL